MVGEEPFVLDERCCSARGFARSALECAGLPALSRVGAVSAKAERVRGRGDSERALGAGGACAVTRARHLRAKALASRRSKAFGSRGRSGAVDRECCFEKRYILSRNSAGSGSLFLVLGSRGHAEPDLLQNLSKPLGRRSVPINLGHAERESVAKPCKTPPASVSAPSTSAAQSANLLQNLSKPLGRRSVRHQPRPCRARICCKTFQNPPGAGPHAINLGRTECEFVAKPFKTPSAHECLSRPLWPWLPRTNNQEPRAPSQKTLHFLPKPLST